jgi:L-aspartate oxidase
MLSHSLPHVPSPDAVDPKPEPLTSDETQRVESLIAAMQASMWTHAGLLRDEPSLHSGLADRSAFESALAEVAASGRTGRRLSEAQSVSCVAYAILVSALARTESRGAHFRNDFPRRDDAHLQKHSILGRDEPIRLEAW